MRREIITCDICGSETGVSEYTVPVFRTYDQTDGRTFYDQPEVVFKKLDLCPSCLRRATNIHDMTVQGYGEIGLEPNPELKDD